MRALTVRSASIVAAALMVSAMGISPGTSALAMTQNASATEWSPAVDAPIVVYPNLPVVSLFCPEVDSNLVIYRDAIYESSQVTFTDTTYTVTTTLIEPGYTYADPDPESVQYALSPDRQVATIFEDFSAFLENCGPRFSDVPLDRSFYHEISWLANSGITSGYSDGTFRPLGTVNRDAMAAFLYRFAGVKDFVASPSATFSDVRSSTPFSREITWLATTEITGGYNDGTFRPGWPVNRDAMAAFLYRFAGEPAFTPPTKSPFDDITPSTPFYKEITWLASTGITGGFSDGTFRPLEPVNRDAMAAFLYRFSEQDLCGVCG